MVTFACHCVRSSSLQNSHDNRPFDVSSLSILVLVVSFVLSPGECSCNFLGTHFSIYDFGMNITRRSNNPLQLMRVEHGLVHYKTNVLGEWT